MARSILRVFAWLGILLFFLGLFLRSFAGPVYGGNYILFGLIVVIASVLLAMSPDILRKDQVTEYWTALIEGANGKAADVLTTTWEFLKASEAPALGVAKKKVAMSLMGGALGNEREFLVLTDKQKLSLRPYQIFINARDYGKSLDVSWYVTCRPTIFQAILSLLVRSYTADKEIGDLNVFDQQDVRAYAMNAKICMRKAVENVMAELGQDASQVDWKSKGFLGIS